jgi:hypothetical protein
MPVTYQISGNIIWIICGKTFVFQEFSNAIEAAMADPQFSPDSPFLFDYRNNQGNVSQKTIIARANYLGALQSKICPTIAVLVFDTLHYGLGRMFQVYTGRYGFKMEIFTDLDEALAFLRSHSDLSTSGILPT